MMAAATGHSVRRRFCVVVSAAAALLLAACLTESADAERIGIHTSEYIQVQGAKLYLLVRGADAHAPVLLWLHGGPGGAERPLFRYFNDELEKDFVVAYWDQRGAGRSFDRHADPKRLTVAQHLSDLDAVVDHLRETLSVPRIVLAGHSWGGALGLLYARAHPDKVLALLAVNPLISLRAAEQSEYEFVIEEASRHHDRNTLRKARDLGEPPFETSRDELAFEALVQQYGGIYHHEPHRLWVMLRALFTGLVTPVEIVRIIQGNNVSLDAMHDELLRLDLRSAVPSLQIPVVFFLGRYDRHVDASIGASYFAHLSAPAKRLVWFEHSAHNIPFEEPSLFNDAVVRALASVTAESTLNGPAG